MSPLRVCIHSIALIMADLGSIILGFGYYSILSAIVDVNQRVIQGSIAAIFCILLFCVWSKIVDQLSSSNLSLRGNNESIWICFAAFLWVPIIFIPLHYFTQGYMTSFGNIAAIWLFQVPVNLLALWISRKILNSRREISLSR
jgi:hypothetical protein